MNSKALASAPVLLVSLFVFLFSALALVVPSGYTYGAALLLLLSLGYLLVWPYPRLDVGDKSLVAALLAYFAVGVATNLYHHLPHNSYDNLSRFLLIVPVLLLLLRVPAKASAVWLGIATGAAGAGFLALWDLYGAGESRAAGHTNAIQFGDIAVLFSCILLTGFTWAKQQAKWIFIVMLIGFALGVLASLFSGARGGWLAFPLVVVLLYSLSGKRDPRYLLAFGLVCIVFSLAIYYVPALEFLRERIASLFDVQSYQQQDINSSLGSRLYMWQKGLEMFALHPFTGWGRLEDYVAFTGVPDEVLTHFNHVHNDFLDALAKRGIAGGLVLIGIYLVPAVAFYRRFKTSEHVQKNFAVAGLVLVLATLVFGLTQTFFSHSSGAMIYLFMLAILWAQTRQTNPVPE